MWGRTRGTLLAAKRHVRVNWVDKIDRATGRRVASEVFKRIRAGSDEGVFPSVLGGKHRQPVAWHRTSKLDCASTLRISAPYPLAKPKDNNGDWWPGSNFRGATMPKSERSGNLSVIGPLTGKRKRKWQMAGPGMAWPAGRLLWTFAVQPHG